MEQNKVLMIVISVAVFLAAIVGVGVALLYPRADADGSSIASSGVEEFDPIEYVRRPEIAPLTPATEETEPVIIVYGEEKPDAPVVEVPAASVPVVPVQPVPSVQTVQSAQPVQPARESRTFGPATTAGQTAAAPAVRTPAPSARTTEYWIQLIASPSRDRVEQARDSLAELNLGGRITTRDVEGTTYFRLRVGPYESKDEANKFLEWIREMERFSEAYISEEYPARNLGG